MTDFNEYVLSSGRCGSVSDEVSADILARYEWFSVARTVRAHILGVQDPRSAITAAGRGASSLDAKPIDVGRLLAPEPEAEDVRAEDAQDEVIERFLHLGDYRIVADDNASDGEILTEAQLSDEDDVVSEELAEVYLSQGLRDEACAIYRKLSLLNPKKSVYFAEIIEKIENNN